MRGSRILESINEYLEIFMRVMLNNKFLIKKAVVNYSLTTAHS